MKKQEKERLHEDDRFIKFVSAAWDKAVAQRTMSLLAVVVVVVILGAWAVVSGTRQHLADKERSAVETAETIEQMEQVAEKYPNAPALLLNLGRAYARRGDKGDLQKAGAALERALASSTVPLQRGMISLDLGIVKTKQGNLKGALEHLDEAARIAEGRPGSACSPVHRRRSGRDGSRDSRGRAGADHEPPGSAGSQPVLLDLPQP